MDKLVGTVGRILYCIPFFIFGAMHLMKAGDMAGMIPSWLPGGVLWVYLTGAAMIAAVLAILTGRQAFLASVMLALMLLGFILTLHVPGLAQKETMQMSMTNLLKDMGLMGGALVLASTFRNSLIQNRR